MGKRYKIWDKKETLIPPSGEIITAEMQLQRFPAATLPNSKFVISSVGLYNLAVWDEFYTLIEIFKQRGAVFPAGISDDQALDIMADWEDYERELAASYISPDERMAAAMEFQNLLALEDITEEL
jgi:hypothetical protein